MPIGPGKYDDLATHVRQQAQAEGVALIVINGNNGQGFSVQASARVTLSLPQILRRMADDIEASFKAGRV